MAGAGTGTRIVGLGAVTGYGWGVEALWQGLLSGKSAATLHPGYGPARDEQAWIALVPDGGDPADGGHRYIRAVRAAVREAVADARKRGWQPGGTVGLVHAIVLGDVRDWRDFYTVDGGRRPARGYLTLLPSTPIATLMREFGFHGPSMNVSAACSSGNVAVLTADLWLAAGMADDVVVVTSDLSCTPEMVEHFVGLGAAVTDADPLTACRPFQQGSRGFVFGEASAAMILSRTGGHAYARVLGGAMTNDAHHVVSIEPGHAHVLDCARTALARAGAGPDEVGYLNAHGTGTAQCDAAERDLVSTVLGDRPWLHAIKPLTGHSQGAAAGVEIAVAALVNERGLVPAPPVVAPAHPRLLDGVRPFEGGLTLKSAIGMGGNNSALVLGPA
ncbi:MAG TPA: beta-ketoacyl synthase N-terminal-like domain-containing protein [Nocardia sp.]|uniref:beta-ketoacyl synthase N-terminal-like domain-containing protein n=1 Tax=Nocardia sp. TaxID=1821 RepID=UPI002B4AC489|nr:beta-ketoacyl synthase N-terminal-like domain-containing protein [Nocardia sp.]HLS77305.1 beta-ketoacyl synthase N-terminal-like domain-containing protein [Nocardia sp.]